MSEFIPFISIGISTIGFLYTYTNRATIQEKRMTGIEEKVEALKEEVKELKDCIARDTDTERINQAFERLCVLETKNELFWKSVEDTVITTLHHPNQFAKDSLLEKFQAKNITKEEINELKEMLVEDVTTKKNNAEAKAASILLARIQEVLFDCSRNKNKYPKVRC